MAVANDGGQDLDDDGSSPTITGSGSVTDGMYIWPSFARFVGAADPDLTTAEINSVAAAAFNFDFGAIGTSKLCGQFPHWLESGWPSTGVANKAFDQTMNDDPEGYLLLLSGVDQTTPLGTPSRELRSSQVPTALAVTAASGGAILYGAMLTGTHDANANDGFTLLRSYTMFTIPCGIFLKLYPSGGTSAVRAVSASSTGYHWAVPIEPAAGGGGGGVNVAGAYRHVMGRLAHAAEELAGHMPGAPVPGYARRKSGVLVAA